MTSLPASIIELIEALSANGTWVVGEVQVEPTGMLRHRADADKPLESLEVKTWPEEAREIAKYDPSGKYRPLKTAPNLRRGWALQLESAAEMRLALDFLYPSALGTFLAALRGEVSGVPLRETLGRQTGMYRLSQLTNDEQADTLISEMCNPTTGCLRHQIWDLAPDRPQPLTEPLSVHWPTQEIPLLCSEACNLLVAACRPLGKANLPKTPKPAES